MAEILALVAAFFFALAATLQQKGALGPGRRFVRLPGVAPEAREADLVAARHRCAARGLRVPGCRAGERTPGGDSAAARDDDRVRPSARLLPDATGDPAQRGRRCGCRGARSRHLHRGGRRRRRRGQRTRERVGDRSGRVLARRCCSVRPRRAGKRFAQGCALRRVRGSAVRPVRVALQAHDGDPRRRRHRSRPRRAGKHGRSPSPVSWRSWCSSSRSRRETWRRPWQPSPSATRSSAS